MKTCKAIIITLTLVALEVLFAVAVTNVFASTSSEVVDLNINENETFSEDSRVPDPTPEQTPDPTPDPTPGLSQEEQDFRSDILTYIATDKKTMTEILVSIWALFGLLVGLHIVRDTMG